jgi:hypothetical protein
VEEMKANLRDRALAISLAPKLGIDPAKVGYRYIKPEKILKMAKEQLA